MCGRVVTVNEGEDAGNHHHGYNPTGNVAEITVFWSFHPGYTRFIATFTVFPPRVSR